MTPEPTASPVSISIENAIRDYRNHFSVLHERVRQIETGHFRKVLYFTLINAYAQAALPTVHAHRTRVVTFLDLCSGWAEKDRVSCVQLVQILESLRQTHGVLYLEMKRRSASWAPGTIVRPDADPTFQEVAEFAEPRELDLVNVARYVELLYAYRNRLGSEIRMSGVGHEVSDDNSNPYHIFLDGTWEMVFPTSFLDRLTAGCLTGLEAFLRNERQNPYDGYRDEPLWQLK